MTIESDSGYSPMALAVALGHKKSMYRLLTPDKYNFIFYTYESAVKHALNYTFCL